MKKRIFNLVFIGISILIIILVSCTIPVSSNKKSNTTQTANSGIEGMQKATDGDDYTMELSGVFQAQYTISKRYGGDRGFKEVDYPSTFRNLPAILADIQTFNSADTAGVRLRNVTRSGLEIKVEEEQSNDSDLSHAQELLSILKVVKGDIKNAKGEIIGETITKTVSANNGKHWRYLNYSRKYNNPVVFATIVTTNDASPCHVRIRNVTGERASYKLEEWSYQEDNDDDGRAHGSETIDFIVLERGSHRMKKGEPSLYWEVNTTDSPSKTWNSNEYILTRSVFTTTDHYPFVFTRCQSWGSGDPVVVRNEPLAPSMGGVTLLPYRLQEEEAKNQYHPSETIGYLVVGYVQDKYKGYSRVVRNNGNLQTKDGKLCNEAGNPIQLKGMSNFWINWEEGKKYANDATVSWLIHAYGIEVLRIAMGVNPYNEFGIRILNDEGKSSGYIDNQAEMRGLVEDLVDSCIKRGIYVIIDWHVHDAFMSDTDDRGVDQYALAHEFFGQMSIKYGGYRNVMFEIWNEPTCPGNTNKGPNESDWFDDYYQWDNGTSRDLKSYSDAIMNVIRSNDPDNYDNIIILPSPWYSSAPSRVEIANNNNYRNCMVAYHFYAGSHVTQDFIEDGHTIPDFDYYDDVTSNNFKSLELAIDTEIPVFVTEWGTTRYCGGQVKRTIYNKSTGQYFEVDADPSNFFTSADYWIDYMKDNDVSWCAWSISDKIEGSSVLLPGTSTTGNWNWYSTLTDNGRYLFDEIDK